MKYLVIKGWLGFGDRLESLKMGLWYAKQYNLKVYVDWSDSMWSHGNESFYTYFKLVNIPTISSLDEIPEDATVYPPYWKDHLKDPVTRELQYKTGELGLYCGVLEKELPADVIVLANLGTRKLFYDSKFFAEMFKVVDRRIIEKVAERKNVYPISKSWGIHIRGTDRVNDKTRSISIQSLASLVTTHGALNGVKMTVVSDDKPNADMWKRFYPDSFIVSELSLKQGSTQGNHNLDKTKLLNSKDEMNVDMLVDFFTLTSTARIYSTSKDSRYAQEARRLQPYVNMILGQ